MKTLLKKYFGYDEFRPMQLDIITTILQEKDTLVIMPTGGGKSICYQLPALKFDGLTIIISPLISLMKDQVDNLKSNGINAEYINSSLSSEEITEIQGKIRRKEIKLLYIAPERLATESFKVFLSTLKISLIAIDEAHCISEWGHDFRPEYRNLKYLKVLFPSSPIVALTATATKKVQEDILKQLSLENPRVFISSFNRENLNLIVRKKKKTIHKIIELLNKHKNESVIIYCFSRKDSENIAQSLKDQGFSALSYHAGLDKETRKLNQELFIKDQVNIIVATIAFGMGIDKPDVRLIIHHTFPKTIEGYYQEIGRAGRDGLLSECVLFYSRGDKRKHDFFVNQVTDKSTQSSMRNKLDRIMSYCETTSCKRKFILKYFGEDYLNDNCKGCDICLKNIELEPEIIDEKLKVKRIREGHFEYDDRLFQKLRVLRKQLADKRDVPPFIIFGDRSLHEMACYFPKNNEEFLKINGVGQRKLEEFGELFLTVINDYLRENNISPEKTGVLKYKKEMRHLSRNYQRTKRMIIEKIPINEIARIEGLKERRIVYHIEKLMEGKERIDVSYLLQKEKLDKIKLAFEKFGIERIGPSYDYFNGKLSYDEIRIARAIIKSDKLTNEKNTGLEITDKDNQETDYHERLREIKNNFSNAYEPWKEEEDSLLKSLHLENKPLSEIAQILKRQPSAIRSRLKKFELLQ